MLRGSYQNGFAPRDGMPLYPSLWRGCVGAWAPCLGPSGLTLRDWSGFNNYGSLTNMTSDGDWVLSVGMYGLDFDENADIVSSVSSIPALTTFGTVSAWANFRTLTAATHSVVFLQNGGSQTLINQFGSSVLWYWGAGAPQVSAGTLTTNAWTHLCLTSDGTTVRAFVNAVLVGSAGSPVSQPSTTVHIGGWPGQSARTVNGQIDDVRIYNRALSVNEICLLASRRGIAYDLAPMRVPYSEQVAGFQAAWALRQRLILGGGGGLG